MERENQWLEQLYKVAFPFVARALQRLGSDQETAKDIFHDALIIYMEKKQDSTFRINVTEQAYITGISKLLWIRKYNNDNRLPLTDVDDNIYSIPEDFYERETRDVELYQYLKAAGRKCLQLLQAFYYDRLPMQDISQKLGYGSVRSATVQKYKCLEKIRTQVKQQEYEDATV